MEFYSSNLEVKVEEMSFVDAELKQELDKNIALRQNSEQSALQKQIENNLLKEEIAKLKSLVSDRDKPVKQTCDKCQHNEQNDNKEYNNLHSQYSELLSEHQQYTSHESIVKLFNLYQQIRNLNSQINATKINMENRTANQNELNKLSCDQDRIINAFNATTTKKINNAKQKYIEICDKNDNKFQENTKRLCEIDELSKSLSKQLETNISKDITDTSSLVEIYIKELFDIKESFVGDFKEEDKLYKEVSKIANITRMTHDATRRLQNKTVTNSSSSNATKNKSKSCNIFLCNFPQSHCEAEGRATVDLMRVKIFLKHFIDDDVDISIKRLPASTHGNMIPIIINLPNEEIVNQILLSEQKIAKFTNIKMFKFVT